MIPTAERKRQQVSSAEHLLCIAHLDVCRVVMCQKSPIRAVLACGVRSAIGQAIMSERANEGANLGESRFSTNASRRSGVQHVDGFSVAGETL